MHKIELRYELLVPRYAPNHSLKMKFDSYFYILIISLIKNILLIKKRNLIKEHNSKNHEKFTIVFIHDSNQYVSFHNHFVNKLGKYCTKKRLGGSVVTLFLLKY
jgi:hypothetical protein